MDGQLQVVQEVAVPIEDAQVTVRDPRVGVFGITIGAEDQFGLVILIQVRYQDLGGVHERGAMPEVVPPETSGVVGEGVDIAVVHRDNDLRFVTADDINRRGRGDAGRWIPGMRLGLGWVRRR